MGVSDKAYCRISLVVVFSDVVDMDQADDDPADHLGRTVSHRKASKLDPLM
jgi:hypothetical protein